MVEIRSVVAWGRRWGWGLTAVEHKGTSWSDEKAPHLDHSGDYKLRFVRIYLHFLYILLYASIKDNFLKRTESLIHGLKQVNLKYHAA